MLSSSVPSFFFFPQLVKTADLNPRHNYVLGFHPHGVLVAGAFTNFCTYTTGFRKLFPGLTSYLLMLPLWFRAPFFRDYIMCAGLSPNILVSSISATCNAEVMDLALIVVYHFNHSSSQTLQVWFPQTKRVPAIRSAEEVVAMLL